MDQNLKFIKNQKGHFSLNVNGFRYNKHKDNKDGSSSWRCIARKICSVTIKVDETKRKILGKSKDSNHTCISKKMNNVVHSHITSLKRAVCEDLRSIQVIYEKQTQKFKEEHPECVDLPSFKSIKDTSYRSRKKFLDTDMLKHSSSSTVKIPHCLGEFFLICEDGDTERIVVFATKLSRKIAKSVKSFFADGTFFAAPDPFYQLYVVHIDLNSDASTTNIIPVIYGLLPNKTQDTYERFYRILQVKLGITITNFKSDYELAQLNAVQIIYPNAKITGCYRHFNAAIWKQFKKLKVLATKEGRNIARLSSILPLVPAPSIPEAWRYISTKAPNTPEIRKFKRYFEKQWYPRLSPEVLSCAGQRHRTTNALEGWHHRLNVRLPKKCGLYLFIHKLRKESRYWDNRIKESLFCTYRGQRRGKDVLFDKKYKSLLNKFNRDSLSLSKFMHKIIFLQLTQQ
ncbi:hypothetical protein ABMA28_010723 [Loxostege sticticalis]|uniref:MULE transposase domain-containing protein n=1 Tax=Loxostege sticticalis TaxID=481309 RepID=A0ABD0SA79_LOXSC